MNADDREKAQADARRWAAHLHELIETLVKGMQEGGTLLTEPQEAEIKRDALRLTAVFGGISARLMAQEPDPRFGLQMFAEICGVYIAGDEKLYGNLSAMQAAGAGAYQPILSDVLSLAAQVRS